MPTYEDYRSAIEELDDLKGRLIIYTSTIEALRRERILLVAMLTAARKLVGANSVPRVGIAWRRIVEAVEACREIEP